MGVVEAALERCYKLGFWTEVCDLKLSFSDCSRRISRGWQSSVFMVMFLKSLVERSDIFKFKSNDHTPYTP